MKSVVVKHVLLLAKINYYLYNLGIACAAVLRTYGDISAAESLMANMTIGTIITTLILDNTLKADARINWFGS